MWCGRRFGYDRWSNGHGSNPIRSNDDFSMDGNNQWEIPMQWTNKYQANGWSVSPMKNQWWSVSPMNNQWLSVVWTFVLAYIRASELIRGVIPGTIMELSRNIQNKPKMAIFAMIGPNSTLLIEVKKKNPKKTSQTVWICPIFNQILCKGQTCTARFNGPVFIPGLNNIGGYKF